MSYYNVRTNNRSSGEEDKEAGDGQSEVHRTHQWRVVTSMSKLFSCSHSDKGKEYTQSITGNVFYSYGQDKGKSGNNLYMHSKTLLPKKLREKTNALSMGTLKLAAVPKEDREAFVKGITTHTVEPFLRRDQLAQEVLKVWQGMINDRGLLKAEDMKWSDVLKASELMAKYAGMFAEEQRGDTYNTVIVDARGQDEKALLERLQRLRAEQEALEQTGHATPPYVTEAIVSPPQPLVDNTTD